jgi:hypothetical protein
MIRSISDVYIYIFAFSKNFPTYEPVYLLNLFIFILRIPVIDNVAKGNLL